MSQKIEVSDVVEVAKIGRCVVLSVRKDYDWRQEPNIITVRLIDATGKNWYEVPHSIKISEYHESENPVIIEKGPGTVTPGVSYKFTPDELRQQRWEAHLLRIAAVDQHYEDYTNAATWMARLYLVQEPTFHSWLQQNRRRDGTINTGKVIKWFRHAGLKVDDWTLLPPIEPPVEFGQYSNPLRPRINWQEIADSFSVKAMA